MLLWYCGSHESDLDQRASGMLLRVCSIVNYNDSNNLDDNDKINNNGYCYDNIDGDDEDDENIDGDMDNTINNEIVLMLMIN